MSQITSEEKKKPLGALTPQDERIVHLVHLALDEYKVYVWNGEDQPKKKPIGEAITCISSDLRDARIKIANSKELLRSIETRKNVSNALSVWVESMKKSFFVRLAVFIIIGIAIAVAISNKNIPSLVSWISKIF